jgi:molybdopterin synthase catalytic subunit
MITALITEERIRIGDLLKDVRDQSAGAIISFSGDVRNHDQGKAVSKLIYEVHPTAQEVLQSIANEEFGRHEVVHISIAHRFGEIPLSESAFLVAVSAPHRQAAFDCAHAIVERVKAELPIWKFQQFEDGSDEWVNSA